ncbi:MAG: class I SAM-dependent methyltransferase [Solirubrobacteraceae bacterium]
MGDDRWWKDFDVLVAATLRAGARVLDFGCGDGGLVERLAGLGFDVVGVDPRAPARPRLIHSRLEDAIGLGEFDAITATMALHHADHDPSDSDNSVAAWHREHHDLHTGATIRRALSDVFTLTLEVDCPYLARMLGQHDLEAEERALIDAHLLPALGCWYIACRRLITVP